MVPIRLHFVLIQYCYDIMNITRPQSAIKYEPSYTQQRARPESAKMIVPGLKTDGVDMDRYMSAHVDQSSLIGNRGGSTTNRISSRQFSTRRVNHSFQPPKPEKNEEMDLSQQRKIPRNIKNDKEHLYVEIQSLKITINGLESENTKLRTQTQSLEKEVYHLQSLIGSVEQFINAKHHTYSQSKMDTRQKGALSENILTVSMKKQIKELKESNRLKDEEIQKLKKDIKFTKMEELRMEIKESQIESMRLHTLLDQAMRNQAITQMSLDFNQMEEKFYIQMSVINSLKQECDYLTGLLRFQEEETFRIENLLLDAKKVAQSQQDQIEEYKKIQASLNTDIENLKAKLHEFYDVNSDLTEKAKKLDSNQMKIIRYEALQAELNKKISDRDLNIEYLDKTVSELKQKLQDKSHYEMKEKRAMQEEISKISMRFDELDDKYKNLLLIQAQTKMKETMPSLKTNTIQITYKQRQARPEIIKDVSNESIFMKQLEYAPKKLRVVKTSDVQPIGKELNMRFRLRKISLLDVVEQYLFDDENKKTGFITIKELHNRLRKEPFLLIDSDRAMLVARYLVEDNSQDFTDFNVEISDSLVRVKSIFQKLIGSYRATTSEEEAKLKEEMIATVLKYRSSLRQHFDSLPSQKGEISPQQVLNTFIYMDIDLRQEVLDYFFLRMFALTNRVDRIPYVRIFEVFQPEPPKEDRLTKRQKKERTLRQDLSKQQFNYLPQQD